MKKLCIWGLFAAMLALCFLGCSSGSGEPDDGGGEQTPSDSSIIYYIPPASSSSDILPLAMITTEEDDEILVLGTFTDSGKIGEIRGLSVCRNDSDTTGYFLNNADNSIAYYYQIDGAGKKLPRLIKADASNVDQDLSVQVYDYDWSTGAASLMTSFYVSGSSGAYSSQDLEEIETSFFVSGSSGAYNSRNLEELETALNDTFRFFLECRTHLIVDMALSVRDYIFARFFDEETRAFATDLEANLTQADATGDFIEAREAFATSYEATESESTAKKESIEGFDSSSTHDSFLSNVKGGIKIISGDGQKGIRNTALDQEVQVIVVDEELVPLAGVEVDFIYEEVTNTVATDSDGYARFSWILGGDVGLQLLTARIKEIAPLGYANNQITITAEALEEYDFLKLELGGVAGSTPTSIPWAQNIPLRLSGEYITRDKVDYLWLTTDYLDFGSLRESNLHLIFPAIGEGTYTVPIGVGHDYKGIDIDPISDNLSSLIGVPKDRYRSYGSKGNFTITVHQDNDKYWGEFSGLLEQSFQWQSTDGNPAATISVTNGSFMFFKE